MEREQEIIAAEESKAAKTNQFPNLIAFAAVLFGVNLLVVVLFYLSPALLHGHLKASDAAQYEVSKSSAFEQTVDEAQWHPRPVEKVRPVIEASAPLEPATGEPADVNASQPNLTPVSYSDAGTRPAETSAIYAHDENKTDGSEAVSQVTASLAPRSADLQ